MEHVSVPSNEFVAQMMLEHFSPEEMEDLLKMVVPALTKEAMMRVNAAWREGNPPPIKLQNPLKHELVPKNAHVSHQPHQPL